MGRSYQEIQAEIETAESQIAELEAKFIYEHDIQSRSGYIPQCFDEIGNEALRLRVQEEFSKAHSEFLSGYESLKAELAKAAA
jgi:hypothetical protein